MSELSYTVVRAVGRPAFWVSWRPTVLHLDRIHRPGAFILAASHLSPYDVPILIALSQRKLDFLSTIEMLRNPLVAGLFRQMNCEFVDRNRPDSATAMALARRLERGRVVAMFPEAGIRTEQTSVVTGGRIRPGVVRLAQLAQVPIIPCVILGTTAYSRFVSWLPLRRTRIGVIFGEPIDVPRQPDGDTVQEHSLERLRQTYRQLYDELRGAMR